MFGKRSFNHNKIDVPEFIALIANMNCYMEFRAHSYLFYPKRIAYNNNSAIECFADSIKECREPQTHPLHWAH